MRFNRHPAQLALLVDRLRRIPTMALPRGCLPLVPFLAILLLCSASAQRPLCQRVFPLELTARAMPCRYICAFYNGHTTGYRIRGEGDGTPCVERGSEGVCWYGACLTRYTQQEDWSQSVDDASKVPRHIRKRDVTAVKGVSVTKTSKSTGGSSSNTKTVEITKSVKTSNSDDSTSPGSKDFKSNFMTSFSNKSGAKGAPIVPTPDIDPFALKTVQSGSHTRGFFPSGGENHHVSNSVKNGGVNIKVFRGPNGEQVTTRTVRRLVISHGPTKTVRRIVIRKGYTGGRTDFMPAGANTVTTKTVSFTHGSTRGSNGLITAGNTGLKTKTAQITTVKTVNTALNPLPSIMRTFKQERISAAPNFGGLSTATKTISTVAVTKKEQPSVSVARVTSQGVTPSTSGSLETANTETLKGLEVELPGYTAGLRHDWKWVLARRVGMYPPYVQVLDPDVLFYKLGLRKPSLPSLPVPIHNILKRVPVHPVGSDLYGFLLSSRILEKIRGITDGVNGLTRLRSILSTSNTSQLGTSEFLKRLFTGDQSSPPRLNLLQKIVLASLSGPGNNPLNSPYSGYPSNLYGGLFGGAYTGSYGSPWPKFTGGQFPANSWPVFGGGRTQLSRFGSHPSDFPGSTLGLYDSSGSEGSLNDVRHTLSDDGLLPTSVTPSSQNAHHLLRDSKYLLSLLVPRGKGRDRMHGRSEFSFDESLEPSSEKLTKVLDGEKLRQLQKVLNQRHSPMRRILRALYSQGYDYAPVSKKRPRVQANSRLYQNILRQLLLRKTHGGEFQPSKFKTFYGTDSDNTEGLVSRLRYLTDENTDEGRRHTSTGGTQREVLELLKNLRERQRTSRYSPLSKLFDAIERRHEPVASRREMDTSDATEVIEDLLSGREPSSDTAAEMSKEITKALLNSGQGHVPTNGRRGRHISKLVSVHGTTHREARPQGLAESQVFSTTYQTTKGAATGPIPLSPTPGSALDFSRSIIQPSQPAPLQGINSFANAASRSSAFQPYSQFVPQPLYPAEGAALSNQAALLNRQIVSSTGSVYGTPLGQPATTMVTGSGGYSGYATYPGSAYISQYAAQPYYVGTSLYATHPHYVVEGHEAPGTRWQLRVWRHQPGVSAVVPSYAGFGSSHLGSVVTRARETVTRGLQAGSQPGQLGFTSYGPSIPGGSIVGMQSQGDSSGWGGTTSQYVVRSPDGSLIVTRQPLAPYGSQTSGLVVSQTTKQTTKTTAAGLPTATSGLLTDSFQTTVGGASSGGSVSSTKVKVVKQQYSRSSDANSELLPELTQKKDSSLLSALPSERGSESSSSISTDGSSSGGTGADSDLSQSKLRR